MRRLRVNLPGREYDILIERGLLDRCGELIKPLVKGDLAVIVTDSTVEPLYARQVAKSLMHQGFRTAVLEVPAGEKSKTPAVLMELWEQMMDVGLTRTDCVIALGGGVIGDLAGFAAATILRGVAFVQIPTTLLAQVDSSVGGKVAVDLEAGKNLAGAFYQPKIVIMDPDCLRTLPDRVFSDGMAEVIKYGCIWDEEFFNTLSQLGGREQVMERIEDVLATCCDIKRQVVEQDEQDTGLRMILNFGHTLGHVYEKAYNYESYTHGEAVAAGMVAAAKLGVRMGVSPQDTPERIADLLLKFSLPTAIAASEEQYRAVVAKDKKSQGQSLNLVVLPRLGEAGVVKLPQTALLTLIKELKL